LTQLAAQSAKKNFPTSGGKGWEFSFELDKGRATMLRPMAGG
jgi:hypothetical protein